MVNEDYQRRGEEEKEFYDNQEGGGGSWFGSKKTDAQREIDQNTNRVKVPWAGPSTYLPSIIPRDNVSKPRVSPSRAFKTVGTSNLQNAIKRLGSAPIANEVTLIKYRDTFKKEFKELLENLLLQPTERSGYTTLDEDKVNLIISLCDISYFNTKVSAEEIFNNINLLTSNYITEFTTSTDEILNSYLIQDVFFLDEIKKFQSKNMRELTTNYQFNTDFMTYILQLLVIYYYPIFLLRTIRNKIIIAFETINKAKTNLIDGDKSITKFSELINTISSPTGQTGGTLGFGLLGNALRQRWPPAADAAQDAAQADAAQADAAVEAAGRIFDADDAAEAADAAAEAAGRIFDADAAKVEQEAKKILTKYIKDSKVDNYYVSNSQKLFYKALINFAVSISVDDNDYYKNKISSELEKHIKELLGVKDDSNQIDITQLHNHLKKLKTELATLQNTTDSSTKRIYEELKLRLLEKEHELSLLTQSSETQSSDKEKIENLKSRITLIKEQIEDFKKDMSNVSSMDSKYASKRDMAILIKKEEEVAGAEKTIQFSKTINDNYNTEITAKNIVLILNNILLDKNIPTPYIKILTHFISEGIKASTMFTFTLNDDKINKLLQAAAIQKNTRAMSATPLLANQMDATTGAVRAMPETMALMEARKAEDKVAADLIDAMKAEKARSEVAFQVAKMDLIKATKALDAAKAAPVANVNEVKEAEAVEAAARATFDKAKNVVAENERKVYEVGVRAEMARVARVAADKNDAATATGGSVGGKRRTRRHKKRAGTRRHKKRSGTHKKCKNTTR